MVFLLENARSPASGKPDLGAEGSGPAGHDNPSLDTAGRGAGLSMDSPSDPNLKLTEGDRRSPPPNAASPRGMDNGSRPGVRMRKRKLQEEPQLTKQVPLGDVAHHTVTIGAGLSFGQERALVGFLMENADIFTWEPTDLPGIPRDVIEHHLAVRPDARPVKQKPRRQAQDRQDFIVEQVHKLKAARAIREVLHPTWIANPVVVPKQNGSKRLCVDFTDLNRACPKDAFPLPRIDQIVDSTAGCDLLCILDAFSGYHQIKMAKEDEEKTAFLMPEGCFCFTSMPFGLKNIGATFQRAMRACLGSQMGQNIDAFINDIVVKTQKGKDIV